MPPPTPGQKTIPIKDWNRFLRVADWFERTIEHGKGVLRPTYGQALIVKTPAGGINARDEETIFSATCIKCVAAETAAAGEKTLHETDEELIVSNFHAADVPGNAFVETALSPDGTRYVETALGLGWDWGKLDGALVFSGTATMSVWRNFPLADTGANITVSAPPLLTSGSLASGSWVWAQKHRGGLWYVMGGQC